jgi:hypothetical protein
MKYYIFKTFVTYFSYTKFKKKLYSSCDELNVNINVFKMKHKKLFNLLSSVSVESCHIFKWDFKLMYFLI